MSGALPSLVKSLLPPEHWRKIRRATNRMRWLLKARLVRHYGFPALKRPGVALKYVFWDPEVESYTYPVANEQEYANFIAPVLNVSPQQVMNWIAETKTDPYLSRDRGFKWSCKRRLPLGNRFMWYPIARALKPKLVVEAGIHEGLSSEMFLAALRRNAQEGHPGRLISFDIYEDTGWLVHPELRSNWQRVLEPTLPGMEPVLQGQEVDLFIHETPHEPEIISGELDVILRHSGPRPAVIDSSGMLRTTLKEYCQRYGTEHHFFRDQPKDHVVQSHGMGFAIFDRARIHKQPQETPAGSAV